MTDSGDSAGGQFAYRLRPSNLPSLLRGLLNKLVDFSLDGFFQAFLGLAFKVKSLEIAIALQLAPIHGNSLHRVGILGV